MNLVLAQGSVVVVSGPVGGRMAVHSWGSDEENVHWTKNE